MSTNLKRQELPPENLGDLTAPPARGAGLSDLLEVPAAPWPASPPPAVEAPTRPADPEPAPAPTPAPAPAAPAAPARPKVTRGPGRPRARTKPASAVYVTAGVKKRFEKYRHDNKATNLQVILEAISTKHKAGELETIIEQSRYSTVPVDDLFPVDPSAVRYLGGGSSPISFSPTPEQEAVIDRIGQSLGFETRSTWIAPVLNAFLPGKPDATAR